MNKQPFPARGTIQWDRLAALAAREWCAKEAHRSLPPLVYSWLSRVDWKIGPNQYQVRACPFEELDAFFLEVMEHIVEREHSRYPEEDETDEEEEDQP
jgi:hypothetical protein